MTRREALTSGSEKAKAVTDYLVDLVNNPNFVLRCRRSGLSGLRDGSVKAMFRFLGCIRS